MDECDGSDPVRVVLDLYAALRDRRIEDMLALVDPEVVCLPLVRPGQSVYYGHAAMAKLVEYMHTVHGEYRVQIGAVTEERARAGRTKVTVEASIYPEPGPGRPVVMRVTSVYTVEHGRITWIESKPRPVHSREAATGPGGHA